MEGILLDTSFFIRLLKNGDPLQRNADSYFKYFIENGALMVISTVSVAEFCVRGAVDQLPLRNVLMLPFNKDHAVRAGEFAAVLFGQKEDLQLSHRKLIPNDTKLFGQADQDPRIRYYLTSDVESKKMYEALKREKKLRFEFLDLRIPCNESFGFLPLDSP